MTVHNILEEEVINQVNNIYDQAKEIGIAWITCDCEQCRLDTATYVLNRIPPKYIVSTSKFVYLDIFIDLINASIYSSM